MRNSVISVGLLVALASVGAHAQHRCIGGEGQLMVSKWSCSDLGLHRAPDAVARVPGSRKCLDPSTILSLEMDIKSTGISAAERRVRVINYTRGRSCQPLLSEFQKEQLRSQYTMERHGTAPATGPRSAIDARTDRVLPGVAGGVIDPKTGTFHQDVGAGYVNSRTGKFSPKQ